MTVIDYITEEVTRQGHYVQFLDGIERVGWMVNAWCYALRSRPRLPRMRDAIELGRLVEPDKNASGIRNCNVRVGPRVCPDFECVAFLLDSLFEKRDTFTPIQFYKEFELIHPFRDGNGRSGKILMAWLGSTLLQPTFPPNDLFGGWIANP